MRSWVFTISAILVVILVGVAIFILEWTSGEAIHNSPSLREGGKTPEIHRNPDEIGESRENSEELAGSKQANDGSAVYLIDAMLNAPEAFLPEHVQQMRIYPGILGADLRTIASYLTPDDSTVAPMTYSAINFPESESYFQSLVAQMGLEQEERQEVKYIVLTKNSDRDGIARETIRFFEFCIKTFGKPDQLMVGESVIGRRLLYSWLVWDFDDYSVLAEYMPREYRNNELPNNVKEGVAESIGLNLRLYIRQPEDAQPEKMTLDAQGVARFHYASPEETRKYFSELIDVLATLDE